MPSREERHENGPTRTLSARSIALVNETRSRFSEQIERHCRILLIQYGLRDMDPIELENQAWLQTFSRIETLSTPDDLRKFFKVVARNYCNRAARMERTRREVLERFFWDTMMHGPSPREAAIERDLDRQRNRRRYELLATELPPVLKTANALHAACFVLRAVGRAAYEDIATVLEAVVQGDPPEPEHVPGLIIAATERVLPDLPPVACTLLPKLQARRWQVARIFRDHHDAGADYWHDDGRGQHGRLRLWKRYVLARVREELASLLVDVT